MSDKLMATVTIRLKADSGYQSEQTERISDRQWGRICDILNEPQSGMDSSNEAMAKLQESGVGVAGMPSLDDVRISDQELSDPAYMRGYVEGLLEVIAAQKSAIRALKHSAGEVRQPVAMEEWIADPDTIPRDIINATRDAISREFGNNGTDGYYKRILAKVLRAILYAAPASNPKEPVEQGWPQVDNNEIQSVINDLYFDAHAGSVDFGRTRSAELRAIALLQKLSAVLDGQPADTGIVQELPPLPPPLRMTGIDKSFMGYTADQMRKYARAALKVAQQNPTPGSVHLAGGSESADTSLDALAMAYEALKINHDWHMEYDEYGGYPDSQLCATNLAAMSAIDSAQSVSPLPNTVGQPNEQNGVGGAAQGEQDKPNINEIWDAIGEYTEAYCQWMNPGTSPSTFTAWRDAGDKLRALIGDRTDNEEKHERN